MTETRDILHVGLRSDTRWLLSTVNTASLASQTHNEDEFRPLRFLVVAISDSSVRE